MALRRLAFVPAMVLLAFMVLGQASLGLLYLATVAGVLGLALLRRAPAPGRVLLLEGLLALGLSAAVLFYVFLGDPVPFAVSPLLGLLLVGTIPVWLAALLQEAARRREAPTGAAAPLQRVEPRRLLALLFVHYGALLALALGVLPVQAAAYGWLVGAATSIGVLPFFLLALPGGRLGRFGAVMALAALLVGLVWQAASLEVAMEQGHALPWDEVQLRLGEPGSWRTLAEGLLSLRFAGFLLVVVGGYAVLGRALRRLSVWTQLLGVARLVGSVTLCGLLLMRYPSIVDPALASGYRETSAAPWSWVHARAVVSQRMDLAAAARLRQRAEPPVWAPGPAEPLAALAGRYPRRSIVLVLLESQALRLVPGLGEGAFGFAPAQPELVRLAASGILFTNYFADNFPTQSARWSVVMGLPSPPVSPSPSYRAPEAARVGRFPDFRALGYRTDWASPASPRFDNWDRVMTEAGVRWWMDNDEVDGFDHEYWTSWGMPDEQLYEVATKRYLSTPTRGTGYFLGLLTVSNHRPYRLPPAADGTPFPADHVGGTRYADYAVGRFVDRLLGLSPAERPIVFITADTGQLEGLRENPPLGILSPESMRIPGLLLLPDGAAAGQRFDGVFVHADLLDLLYMLVAPAGSAHPKFVDRHRVIGIAMSGGMAVTTEQVCVNDPPRCYTFDGRWQLRPLDTAAVPRLFVARRQFVAESATLWRPDQSTADRGERESAAAPSDAASPAPPGQRP